VVGYFLSEKSGNQMQTITDEVGTGPVQTESGERVPVSKPRNVNVTVALDGRRERRELNLTGGSAAPLGVLVHTLDNGPDLKAANDNNALARKNTLGDTKRYPLGEMYERGELGISEIENRRHWFDSQRFKKAHADARGEPDNEDNWRELMSDFFEGFFSDYVASFEPDAGLVLSDDMEFEDSTTPADFEVVDNAGWNPYRDSEPHGRQLYAQQVVALMADVLGNDYEVLRALIERGFTSQQIGETEGYTNRASASACGKGMLRSALRNLSRFYVSLDRLEERGERPPDAWPLVGAYTWPPVRYTSGQYRPLDKAFMNKAAGPVLAGIPNVYKDFLGVSTPRQSNVLH
jgi:hypothetical protein